MKKDIETILRSMKEVRMDVGEKAAMKKRLLDAIDPAESRVSSASWYSLFWSHQFRVAYAVLFITLSVSSGVVFAAENALPGDVLYAVKTKVTERVERAFVAAAPETQARFETKLVERRLQEAEKLDKKETFKEETKKIAKEEIEKQAEKAESAFEKVRIARKPSKSSEPDVNEDATIMQMSTFSAPQAPAPEENSNAKMNAKRNFREIEAEDSDDRGESSRKGRDSRDDKKGGDDDKDLDLEKVFEKHKEIIKKLDIRKNNRSHGED